MAIGQLMMGAAALGGGVGGLLGGGAAERQGYGRAIKQQPYANALLGIGDMWGVKSAMEQARKQGTPVDWEALRADAEAKGLPTGFLDLAQAGGIQGIRKDYQQQLLDNAGKGFGAAREAVSGSGRQARQGVYGQQEKALGDVSQQLQQAGLQSSNIAQQARANVSYQTGRTLSEIDTQIGQMLADLGLQESSVMDQVLARNLGMEEQGARDLMSVIVGNAGYGPYASSTYFGNGQGYQPQGVDYAAVGQGIAGLGDMLFGSGGLMSLFGSSGSSGSAYGMANPAKSGLVGGGLP